MGSRRVVAGGVAAKRPTDADERSRVATPYLRGRLRVLVGIVGPDDGHSRPPLATISTPPPSRKTFLSFVERRSKEDGTVPKNQPDMIRGTLDMLILQVVSMEPMHGWGISERIQEISQEALQVNQGSLYPSLHRLTREGWIRSEWRTTDNNRRARYYLLTRAGETQLGMERETWARLSAGVARILATT
jgi:transcriptional regulator